MGKFVNPLAFVAVLCFVLYRFAGMAVDEEVSGRTDALLLTVCVTLCFVYFTLALARAIAHRGGASGAVWGTLYLLTAALLFVGSGRGASNEELSAAYRSHYEAWKKGGDPCAPDENGESLLTLAASLGKIDLLERLLNAEAEIPVEMKRKAALLAAENRRSKSLELLLRSGVGVNDAVEGSTLLCAAALSGHADIVEQLLKAGADPNLADADQSTALIHAVIADDPICVRLLMEAGADPTHRNNDGRDAAGYSVNSQIDQLLNTAKTP